MSTLFSAISEHLGTGGGRLNGVLIGARVRSALPAVLNDLPSSSTVAVLMDEVPYLTADGIDVKAELVSLIAPEHAVRPVVLSGDVHADEVTVEAAAAGCVGADVVVTVGSGTLCDIGKVVAGSRPHVVVQTAASVNGFADDQSVLLINGVKRTAHSAYPHTLLIDEQILVGAPSDLNRSGLGDMISMFTAPADWYLSSLFGMDRGFDRNAATMTRRYGDELLAIAGGIGTSEPTALAKLAEFLTLSGISMGVAGQTSPSSGMEHTVSHMIDMWNGTSGRPNALHGEQVGVATVLVSLLWRNMAVRMAQKRVGPLVLPDAKTAESTVRRAFAWMDAEDATFQECWADYSTKLDTLRVGGAEAQFTRVVEEWPVHEAALKGFLMTPERIVDALRRAGAPTRFSELSTPISEDTVIWALSNCHLMRNRFSIADLAFLTGHWEPADVWAAIEEADAIGAGT